MEVDKMEMTTQQVADALGVPKRTVLFWLKHGRIRNYKPYNSNKRGYRTTVGYVREFVRVAANDEGRSEDRLNKYAEEVLQRSGQEGGNTRTSVLTSGA